MSGYRDDRAALEGKVDELTRELASSSARLAQEDAVLAALRAEIDALRAAINHETTRPAVPVPEAPAAPVRSLSSGTLRRNGLVLFLACAALATLLTVGLARRRQYEDYEASKAYDASALPYPSAAPDAYAASSAEVFGETRGVGFDDQRHVVVVVTDKLLIFADSSTLEVSRSVPLAKDEMSSFAQPIPKGERVAVVTNRGVFFHETSTDAIVAKYLFRGYANDLPKLCDSPPDEIVLETDDDGVLRFDSKTGTKRTGPAACRRPQCHLNQGCETKSPAVVGMACGRAYRSGDSTFASCEEDGTREHFLVALDPRGATRWRTKLPHSFNMFVADETVIGSTWMDDREVAGYSQRDGALLWKHHKSRFTFGRGAAILVEDDGTLLLLAARDGHEIARLHRPSTATPR